MFVTFRQILMQSSCQPSELCAYAGEIGRIRLHNLLKRLDTGIFRWRVLFWMKQTQQSGARKCVGARLKENCPR